MIVKFQSVRATNFRSFKEFSLNLENAGTTLVRGKIEGGSETLESNGAGKSSIFSAISWGLFGKFVHVSGAKVSGDKVIRRNSNAEGCSVSVSLRTDEHQLTIERYRGHGLYGDKIRLFVDDKQATQSSNPKTQQMIEALLGITPELFFNLIYISEATLRESFAFESDSQRKKILVGALPQFQQFNKARVAVKDSLSQYVDSIKKLEAELFAHEMTISELASTSSKVDTAAVEVRMQEIKALNLNRNESLKNLEVQIKVLKNEITYQADNETSFQEGVKRHEKILTLLQQQLTELYSEQKRLKNSVRKFESLSGVCPTCEQLVIPEQKQMHEDAYRQELSECETRISSVTDLLSRAMEKHSQTVSLRDSVHRKIQSLNSEVQGLELEFNNTSKSLEAERVEYRRLESFLKQVSTAHAVTETRVKELTIRVDELKTLIGTAKQYEAALKSWLDGFGPRGVVSHGLGQVLETLTEKTEQWLWKLWHEGASFQFEIIGDDLSKIEAKLFLNQALVDVESLSSGETRRLCLAICFGLREALQTLVGWRSNLLVLDEVFDGLDSVGRTKVLHELKSLSETNTFVISQFPQLGEDIDHIIDVIFSSGISILKQL